MSRRKVCLPSTIFTPSSAGASYVHIGTGNIFKLIYTYFLFSGLWGKRGGKTCRNNFFSKTVFKLFCGVGGGVRSYNVSIRIRSGAPQHGKQAISTQDGLYSEETAFCGRQDGSLSNFSCVYFHLSQHRMFSQARSTKRHSEIQIQLSWIIEGGLG